MTERQINSVRATIDKIKKALAADKRKWGGFYDDSRGFRYLPPEHYLKIQDYSGALKYYKWFTKNFPDDVGYPDFLFEWIITLFYNNKLKEAEKKAFQMYFANPYYFDKFFKRPLIDTEIKHYSSWQMPEMTAGLIYSFDQPQLKDFSIWLDNFINSENYKQTTGNYVRLEKELEGENNESKRKELIRRRNLVKENAGL